MEINHVLIVEDDKEIREGVQIYLQSQGYVVFQAADGIEGLEILDVYKRQRSFCLLMSCIRLSERERQTVLWMRAIC